MKVHIKRVFVKRFLVIFLIGFLCFLCANSYLNALRKDNVHLGLIGAWGNYGDFLCVELIGLDIPRYAYCGTNKGLLIFNITAPSHPKEILFLKYGTIHDICVFSLNNTSKKYAALASGANGLVILDITNPDVPIYMGEYHTSGYAYSIAVAGSYAYVGDDYNGFVIMDISDPTSLKYVGRRYYSITHAYDIEVADSYTYIVDGYNGVVVVDVYNPSDPKYAGCFDTDGCARCIVVKESFAYIADGESGLIVIDISNPCDPKYVGCYDTGGYAYAVAVVNHYAYVADYYNGLVIIDISNPDNLLYVGRYDTNGYACSVAVADSYAYIADGDNSLVVIDISYPLEPQYEGGSVTTGSIYGIKVVDTYAYIVNGYNGFIVVDISEPSAPKYAGSYNTDGYAYGVGISGSYSYIADYNNGLVVIDISEPSVPKYTGWYDTDGDACGIALADSYAYIADGDNGLVIIDISNPSHPKYTGWYDTDGDACGIALADSYAYIADGDNGLVIIDISNPSHPHYVGLYDTYGYACDVAIEGSYLYLADDSNGLVVIDISDPMDPGYAGWYDTDGYARGIAVMGSYAYITDYYNGLVTLKINTLPTPKGNLILALGGSKDSTHPYWNAAQDSAYYLYTLFNSQGYENYEINYLTPSPFGSIFIDDPSPTKEGLLNAITTWAPGQFLNMGPLYIALIGHGAEDCFQVMPNHNDILSTNELYAHAIQFQQDTNRPVVLLIESAASGSFIDNLASDSLNPFHNLFFITSTGYCPSYILPPSDPNSANPDGILPISFISLFMKEMANYSLEDTASLVPAFIAAREKLYNYGRPFLNQSPQMYIPGGPIALFLTPNPSACGNDAHGTLCQSRSLLITKDVPISLTPMAIYPDGATISLKPLDFHLLSSNTNLLNPNDPNQLEITPNVLILHPHKNGISTLIAYLKTDHSDILLTASLFIEVSIPGNQATGGSKAIIVAGSTENQYLTDQVTIATTSISHHAYLTLRQKNLSRNDIFYFHPDHYQDVDGNGSDSDDIDGFPNQENIIKAFKAIASTGAEDLIIFLVDHGNYGRFCLNPKEEINDSFLAGMLCEVSPSVTKPIILLIDACHSGSFVNLLPQAILDKDGDPNRVIILTSTSDEKDQAAFFGPYGLLSFSYPFFDEFLLTNSITRSYAYASFYPLYGQKPSLSNKSGAQERDTDLIYFLDDPRPVISSRSFSRNSGLLRIEAQIFSLTGIDKVQAFITSCADLPDIQTQGPITNALVIPLDTRTANSPYGGWYSAEVDDPYPDTTEYQIILTAQDQKKKVSQEKTTLPCLKKTTGVIILVSDLTQDKKNIALSHAIDEQSSRTYQIFRERDFHNEDILYVKGDNTAFPDEERDYTPAEFSIQEHLLPWIKENAYSHFFIYLIGENGTTDLKEDTFLLTPAKSLFPEEICGALPEECRVTLIGEMPQARSFFNALPHRDNLIGIASPGIDPDRPLFSNFLFSRVYCFDPLGEAFLKAFDAYTHSLPYAEYLPPDLLFCQGITPYTDRNTISRILAYSIGPPPIFGNENTLIKDTKITIIDTQIILMLTIYENAGVDPNSPHVALRNATGEVIFFPLIQQNDTTWHLTLPPNTRSTNIFFSVTQLHNEQFPGIIDWRMHTLIRPSTDIAPWEWDPYEWPNEKQYASRITIGIPQTRTFHDPNDTDAAFFYAHQGEVYIIVAQDTEGWGYYFRGSLYTDEDEEVVNKKFSHSFSWQCLKEGYYTLLLEPWADPDVLPFAYTIAVEYGHAPIPSADIVGRIVNEQGKGINGLTVSLGLWEDTTGSIANVYGSAINPNTADGWFFIGNILAPGKYKLMVIDRRDPDTVLKSLYPVDLSVNEINFLGNIKINISSPDPNSAALSGFENAYTNWQKKYNAAFPLQEDSDGDTFINLEEFLWNTIPNDPNSLPRNTPPVVPPSVTPSPPTAPSLNNPVSGGVVIDLEPVLSVINSWDDDHDSLFYQFELYAQAGLRELIDTAYIPGGELITSWTTLPLAPYNTYYWRVRAYDGAFYSSWMPTALFSLNPNGIPTELQRAVSSLVFSSDPNQVVISVTAKDSPIQGASIVIPPGAFSSDTQISISIVKNPLALSANIIALGQVIDFEPSGLTFSKDITIMFPYTQKDLEKAGIDTPSLLELFVLDPFTLSWNRVSPVDIDEEKGLLIIHTNHLSLYALGRTIPAPKLTEGTAGKIKSGGCFIGTLLTEQKEPVIPPEMKISSTPNPVGSGARALGMGGAFISVADDATAASWNPAGLINLKRKEVSLAGSFFSAREDYDTRGVSVSIDDQFNGQHRLNYLSAAFPFTFFSRRMVFSLNYQHLYEFSEERSVYFSDYIEEAFIDRKKSLHIKQKGALGPLSPALAVQVFPSFYLGMTGNFWVRECFNNEWENMKTVQEEGIVLGKRRRAFAEIYEKYKFSGFNLHFGCLWKVTHSFRVGGVVKTPFKAHVFHTLRYVSLEENLDDPADYTYSLWSQSESFKLKMPFSYGLGGTLGLLDNYLMLSLDVYHTEWDVFLMSTTSGDFSPIEVTFGENPDIKPTTQIRLGVEYLFLKGKKIYPLRAGIFYDPEPASGKVNEFYGVSIGTGILFDDFSFDIAYQYRFGKKRDAEQMQGNTIYSEVREHYFYSSVIVYF